MKLLKPIGGLIITTLFLLLSVSGQAAIRNWIGSGDGVWNDGRNWIGGVIPAPGDDVVINQSGFYTVTLDVDANINSLSLGTGSAGLITVNITGHNFSVGAGGMTVLVDGVIQLNSGTFTGTGSMQMDGELQWNGGILAGSGSLNGAGRFTLATPAAKNLNDLTLSVSSGSLIDWQNGELTLNSNASISVLPGANFLIQNDNILSGAGSVHISGGILQKTAGGGTAIMNAVVNNHGNILLDNGLLQFANNGYHTGSFTAATNTGIIFSNGATHLLDGVDFHGPGTFAVDGATLEAVPNGTLLVAASRKPQGRAAAGIVTINSNAVMEFISGTLNGAGDWQIDGALNWNGGSISGTGGTFFNGSLNIMGPTTKTLISRTLTLDGTTTWTGGDISPANSAVFRIGEGANFNIQTDKGFFSGGILELDGILNKNTTLGTTTISSVLNSHDTLNINSGTLILNNSGTHDTQFNVASGATLAFNGGTHSFNDSVMVGPGQVIVDGTLTVLDVIASKALATSSNLDFILTKGTLRGDGNWILAGLEWQGGTIAGAGGFTLTGPLDWTTSASKTLDTRTLTFPSPLVGTWLGGNITLLNGAVLQFDGGSTFDIQADQTLLSANGGTVQIQGTLTKSAGTGTTSIQSVLNNQNTVNVNQGTLQLHGNGTHGSHFNVTTGSVLRFSGGTHTLNNVAFVGGQVIVEGVNTQLDAVGGSTVSASGVNFIFNGGTLAGAGDWDLSNLEWQDGTISGTGLMLMNGPLNISTAATKALSQRRIVVNNGHAATWIDGHLAPANAAVLQIDFGATLDIQGNNNLLSGGTLELQGTLNKHSAGLTSIQSTLIHDGVINVNQGTLELTQNGTHNSDFNITTAGAILNFAGGTQTLNGITLTGPGQAQINGATLEVPLGHAVTTTNLDLLLTNGTLTGAGDWTVAGLNWQGGQISGDGAFVLNGPLNFTTFSTKTLDKRIITIPNGFTATWLDGGIDLNTNGLLDFQAGAIFDIQCDKVLFSGGQIANAGTLRKTAGSGTTTLDSPLVNIGLVSVNSGVLNINNGYTQTAGTLLVDHAVLTSPTLPLLIQGGQLSGHGLIIGNVTNQSELIPGVAADSIGQLTIQGSYTQTATGSLLMDLGGIDPGVDMDQLAVNGASVLDGTLDVALLGGFTPVLGDDFVLLNGTTTGAFVTTNFPTPPADTEYQLTSLSPVVLSLVGTGSATLVVNSTNDIDDGVCDATHCSLREAISFAELNSPFTDTIDLTGITGTITLLSPLPILTESIHLNGPGAALLNIDRVLLGHVLEIDSPDNDQTFTFSRLTLSRGLGGAANGGVMRIDTGDTVQISDSVIEGGNAINGGGIYNAGNLILNHTTFSNNQATLEGGALYNAGILTLQNSTLSNNSANAAGGALCNGTVSGVTSIVNSTFSGNTAAHGSAIGHEGSSITLNNVTITDNTGTDDNGSEAALLDVIGNLAIKNSIVANNNPINCAGVNSIGEFNLESGIDCGFSGVNDVQNADPLLGSLQNNTGSTATHALLAGSPAVDSGNDAACEVLDQRGINRPQDGNGDGADHCDMGAYELLPIAAVNSLDDSDDGVCDNNHCSLREAINTANAFPGLNGIDFNLSGVPPFVISPTSALPEITDAVVIDGETQPGFAGTPVVQIDGHAIYAGADGLVVSAGNSVLRGLAVTRFFNGVVFAVGGNNRLENSFIGTDTTGSASRFGNASSGVVVTASNNNFIGEVGKGNVIVGNGNFGLLLISNASGNQVIDNRVGIDLHDLALGNGQGGIALVEAAHHNTIGLPGGTGRNFIAGNGAAGILIQDSGSDHNVIQSNFIGTDSSGLSSVSNTGNGITIGLNSSHNLIGDTTPDLEQVIRTKNLTGDILNGGNLIAFNQDAGIAVTGNGNGNALYTNWIHSNTGLGIDLGGDGVTANDVLDGDTGSNNLQNYPVITSAVLSGSSTVISGTLNSSPSTAFTLELFQNSSCDSTSFGEGEQPILATGLQTDINGNASFTLVAPAIALSQSITAIATRVAAPLDSSEFSQCVLVTAPTSADLQVTKTGPTSGLVGEPARYQITVENLSLDAADHVVLTDSISPMAVQFVAITQSQGQCSHGTSDVGCSLGSLAAGASATVTVELIPLAAGTLVNQATVSADTADPVDTNNHASVTTLITDPVVNHAPIAHSKTVNTAFNTAVGITLTGTDADNDALSFSLLSQPEQGTLSGTAPNLLYTPNTGFSGQDSFSFKVNDGQVDSEPASVNITVQAEAANQAPQALNLNLVTAVETAVGITLSGSDADGDSLSFRIINNPNHGSLSGLAPNLSYTPDPLFTGLDQFSFVVNDGQVDSAVAIVMINVINPELVVTPESLPNAQVGAPYTFNWAVSGGTPPYTIQLEGVPSGLNFVADSLTLEGIPTTPGDFNPTLTIVDQLGQNFSHSYPLRINPAPLDLTITTNSLPNAIIGFEYLQILAASGGQAPYQWQVTGLPSGLSATADGVISGQAEQAGLFVVSVTITDALQQSAQADLNLAVVNQGLLPLTTQLPHILANQTVDIPILLTGGIPPYHCELAPGSVLPPDLVLNDCLGSLEGQVREPGDYTFTIHAIDSSEIPLQGSVTLTLHVVADTPIPAGEAPVLEEAGATSVPDLSTTKPGAGFADESLENLASDLLGHRYVTGFAYNGKDYDIQLLQFDRNGHVLWRQVFDAGSHEYGYGLAVSPYDQSLFVAGLGLVGNRYQAILLNYDTTGVLRWQKTLSESAADALYAVVVDQTGVYAVGERYNGHDFDALIARFNQAGDLQWQTQYATQTNDTAYHADLSCTPACVLSVVGAQGVNGRSGWIARVNPQDGVLQTTQLIPQMAVLAVQTLSTGDVVIGGTQANNWLLQRLDHTLTPVWQSTVDQGADDLFRALAVDREDFIYAVGRSSNGRNNDAAVVALQPSGQVITELLFDQGQDERAYAVDIDSEGQLFVAGQKLSGDNSEFLILRVQNGKSIEAIDLE